jgi:hypothetical protein
MIDPSDTAMAGLPSLHDETLLQDAIRVNVSRPSELKYWLDRFGVTQELLEKAVATVGTTAGDVAAWLRIRR